MAMNTLKLQKAVGKNISQFNSANRKMTIHVHEKWWKWKWWSVVMIMMIKIITIIIKKQTLKTQSVKQVSQGVLDWSHSWIIHRNCDKTHFSFSPLSMLLIFPRFLDFSREWRLGKQVIFRVYPMHSYSAKQNTFSLTKLPRFQSYLMEGAVKVYLLHWKLFLILLIIVLWKSLYFIFILLIKFVSFHFIVVALVKLIWLW